MKLGYWLLFESSEWLLSLASPSEEPYLFSPPQITYCYLVFWPCYTACEILVSLSGTEHPNQGLNWGAPAVRARRPNHWTIREFLAVTLYQTYVIRSQQWILLLRFPTSSALCCLVWKNLLLIYLLNFSQRHKLYHISHKDIYSSPRETISKHTRICKEEPKWERRKVCLL